MKTLTHETVAQCAYQIWQEYGCPTGRDTEIWLEAERRLAGAVSKTKSNSAPREGSRRVGENQEGAAFAKRAKSETAAESMVEFNISPPISEEEAIKAALQEKQARAPKQPAKTAPKMSPPESGKPLWDKPHSS